MNRLINWLTSINTRHGWAPALIVLIVLVAAAVGVIVALGLEPADFVRWLVSVG